MDLPLEESRLVDRIIEDEVSGEVEVAERLENTGSEVVTSPIALDPEEL